MAQLQLDLSEEQFRVLDAQQQCKVAKSAVVAAVELDAKIGY